MASVRIEPRFGTVSPGEAVDLRARVADAGGHRVLPAAARLRWTSTDTSVVRVDADGKARVVGQGEAELVASAGGWRADTLRVTSGDLARTPAPLLLAEDWSRGIDTARWIPVGDPPATVVSAPGPWAHAFLNDGDANYASGVVSRNGVPLAGGVTMEWWASLPTTGRHFQNLRIGLAADTAVTPGDPRGVDPPVLGFSTEAVPARTEVQSQSTPASRAHVPLPDRPGAWHRYALELRPDGTVFYLVDGRLRWRSGPGFVRPVPTRARIMVGGRTLRTRILVGPVRLYRGLRWTLPGAVAEGRIARR